MVPQNDTTGAGSNGDGTNVRLHRSVERMCFPAFPFAPVTWPTFREMTNTIGIDFENLTYHNVCRTTSMQSAMETLDAVGLGVENPWSPVSVVLRPAEAADAIKAFAASGYSSNSTVESGGMLLCGITMTGGLLYSMVLLPLFALTVMPPPRGARHVDEN